MLPNKVSFSESTRWVRGPMANPMMIRNRTSGILRLLKMEENRWAAKINRPMIAMIKPILLDESPVEMFWFNVSICPVVSMVIFNRQVTV